MNKTLNSEQRALVKQVNWCARVVRNLDLGEVVMGIDRDTPQFYIRKRGMITHRFLNLDRFTRFVEHCVERKLLRRSVEMRRVPRPYIYAS